MTTATHDGRPIVEQRQTKLELYVTAKEAYEMWLADPEDVKILDVRTPEEWVFTGHAPMATLIPFAFMAYVWDAEKQGFTWSLSPDFLARVKERFAPEDTILVTCRSGGRGAMACNMMAGAGYTKAYNILDGMEGDRVHDDDSVFDGMRRKNGWIMSGLPWTYDLDPDVMALPKREEPGELHPGNAAD